MSLSCPDSEKKHDLIFARCLWLCLRGGLSCLPGEVSLVGVDNNPLGKMALPSLTSIDVHCRQQAELSIRKLISFVCGEEYDPLRFLVPTELVQGDSVKQV